MIAFSKAVRALAMVEILDRSKALFIAIAIGILPLALYFSPSLGPYQAADLWAEKGLIAQVLAALFAGLVAIGGGATLIGRDLAERRFSFYLARPVSGWTIWTGKLLGAATVVLASYLLVLLPAASFSSFQTLSVSYSREDLITFQFRLIVALLLAIFVGHFLAMSIRARGAWTIVDLVGSILVSLAAWNVFWRLVFHNAPNTLDALAVTTAIALAVTFFIAGGLQIERARTRFRQGHRVFSVASWSMILLTLAAVELVSRWVVSPTPKDLVRIHSVVTPAAGSSLGVFGQSARGFDLAPIGFLFDVDSGKWQRTRVWATYPAISSNGRQVVWTEPVRRGKRVSFPLFRADLNLGGEPIETGIELASSPDKMWLAPDGKRIAIGDGGTLAVYELDSGNLLAAASTDVSPNYNDWWFSTSIFRGNTVRLFASLETGLDAIHRGILVFDLDLTSRRKTELARILPEASQRWFAVPEPDGERMIIASQGSRSRSHLYDSDGSLVSELAAKSPESRQGAARFLADGRVALIEKVGSKETDEVILRIFSADGRDSMEHTLGLGFSTYIGFQPSPGSIWLYTLGAEEVAEGRIEPLAPELYELELESGSLIRHQNGIRPLGSWWWEGVGSVPRPGDPVTRLGLSQGALVRIDSPTQVEVVLGGR